MRFFTIFLNLENYKPSQIDLLMSRRQSEKMAESLTLTDLPPNILIEILVRLPLQTLVASRRVCKAFLNLTTPNPHFIDLLSSHVTQILALQFGDVFKPSPLLQFVDPELDVDSGFVENLRSRPIFRLPSTGRSSVNLYRSSFREENKYVLVNSCDGLLYFVRRRESDDRSLVCNPVTSEYLMIPDVDVGSRIASRTKSTWLGFSSNSNRYKVLRLFGSVNRNQAEVGAQLLVIGSGSWRYVEHMPPLGREYSWDECSSYLNGVIYWLDKSREDIVFFDFDKEMFAEMVLPPEFGVEQLRNIHSMSIGVLGGCLCVSYNDYNAHRVDIWIKKKTGSPDSWSKEFVVDIVRPMGRPFRGQFKPLQVLRNGEIVMLCIKDDLIYYNPRTKSLRFAEFHRMRLNPKAATFTPSFTSLKETLSVDMVIVQYVRPRYECASVTV